jgi:hypothetical protein
LKRRKDELYRLFGVDNCLFIRPDSGFKTFTGRVVSYEEFDTDYEWMTEFSDRDALAVISSPKPIGAEFRFVICKNAIVTGCYYKVNSELRPEPFSKFNWKKQVVDLLFHNAWKFAEEVAKVDWEPEPIYVMDVCSTNNECKILELNSFSCSGLYWCDLKKVVKVASELAVEINREENSL